ncbi:MAG: hypothetical protein EOP23_15660 [Hyphomicrobiales bacterium]|nr:MAG: hypothetical protein EOP23_15660 [Hyphomicrobiales bacterium]
MPKMSRRGSRGWQTRFEARDKLRRLVDLVESCDIVDDEIDSRNSLRRDEIAKVDAKLERLRVPRSPGGLFAEQFAGFGQLVAANIANSPVAFRKIYLRAPFERVVSMTASPVLAEKPRAAEGRKVRLRHVQEFRRSVLKWRARKDSNL